MITAHVIFDNFKGREGKTKTEKIKFESLPRIGEHIMLFEENYVVARVSYGAESGSITIIAIHESDEDENEEKDD